MNSIDASALNDHKTNACNPIVGITFERCSGETLRTVFRHKMPDSQRRFRSRLVKKLGTYYYQEIPPDEIDQALDKAVSIRTDITTWDQVSRFCADYQDDIFPDNELQWSVHIFPEFEDNSSLILMKEHHVMTDGMGALIMFATLQDKYDPKQLIQTSQVLSAPQKFLLVLLKPFLAVYGAICFLTWKNDRSGLKGPMPVAQKS